MVIISARFLASSYSLCEMCEEHIRLVTDRYDTRRPETELFTTIYHKSKW